MPGRLSREGLSVIARGVPDSTATALQEGSCRPEGGRTDRQTDRQKSNRKGLSVAYCTWTARLLAFPLISARHFTNPPDGTEN